MAGAGARGFTAGPQVFGRTVLASGARIVTEELPGRPTVSLGVWVGSGSRVEGPGLEGGAHFIEHLLFKGTKKRTAAALAKEIDAIGGHLDAFTSREYTAFYLNLLVDHVERGMEILADILLSSTFPAAEVERERRVILEEIRSAEDNPEDCVYELLVQGLWGGNALGRPILGGPASVGAVRARGCSSSSATTTAPATSCSPAPAASATRSSSGSGGATSPSRSARTGRRRAAPRVRPGFYGRARDLEQTYLACAAAGSSRTTPTATPLRAQHDRRREHELAPLPGGAREAGLAYSVFSSHIAYRDAGMFSISVGTRPDQAARVVRIVRRELERIAERAPARRRSRGPATTSRAASCSASSRGATG